MDEKICMMQNWLETATKGIRFGPDRAAVRGELAAHLEDKTADLARIFPDMVPEEARERALSQMGDPVELGKELARVHKPWLGYLWRASQVALALALGAALLLWIPRLGSRVEDWWWTRQQGKDYAGYADDCFLRGVDPYGEDGPYDPEMHEDTVRTLLAAPEPGESVRAGDYSLRVSQAALWSFRKKESGTEYWELYCQLRAAGFPWQPMDEGAARRIRGVDSLGNRYYSYYSTIYGQAADRGEDGYLVVNYEYGVGAPWERSFFLRAQMPSPGAQWLRLEYDCGGTTCSLTIPFDMEEGVEDG